MVNELIPCTIKRELQKRGGYLKKVLGTKSGKNKGDYLALIKFDLLWFQNSKTPNFITTFGSRSYAPFYSSSFTWTLYCLVNPGLAWFTWLHGPLVDIGLYPSTLTTQDSGTMQPLSLHTDASTLVLQHDEEGFRMLPSNKVSIQSLL